jgi:pseudouridine synthase
MDERLQKILSRSGFGSRRTCEKLISSGSVLVNGNRAVLGQKANLHQDVILVNGSMIRPQENKYIKLYKPKGILSSTTDELERGRPTVRDMAEIPGHLYPVGRLDKQSEGLMLLTNDGELTHHLTHPSFGHKKVYSVRLEGLLPDEQLDRWREGVYLDARKTAPARIDVVYKKNNETKLTVTLREGKKRQIRRIAASFGYPVKQLIRLQIGSLTLGDLRPGDWKHLSSSEIQALQDSIHT